MEYDGLKVKVGFYFLFVDIGISVFGRPKRRGAQLFDLLSTTKQRLQTLMASTRICKWKQCERSDPSKWMVGQNKHQQPQQHQQQHQLQ
jgi:hypothetical protein